MYLSLQGLGYPLSFPEAAVEAVEKGKAEANSAPSSSSDAVANGADAIDGNLKMKGKGEAGKKTTTMEGVEEGMKKVEIGEKEEAAGKEAGKEA